MKEKTRKQVWKVLLLAFNNVLRILQERAPEVVMEARSSYNEFFLFRSYAEYSIRERVVVITFDIQAQENQCHIWGDLVREDGFILDEIMEEMQDCNGLSEAGLVEWANEFGLRCESRASKISDVLSGNHSPGAD